MIRLRWRRPGRAASVVVSRARLPQPYRLLRSQCRSQRRRPRARAAARVAASVAKRAVART
eukprot:2413577-Alexandrium_andersonii.AAC.1